MKKIIDVTFLLIIQVKFMSDQGKENLHDNKNLSYEIFEVKIYDYLFPSVLQANKISTKKENTVLGINWKWVLNTSVIFQTSANNCTSSKDNFK